MQQLGENIYRYRNERGLSQGDLANAVEVSRQSVSKWENNSAVPELDKLIKMSRLFGLTLDELVFGKEEDKELPAPPTSPTSSHQTPSVFTSLRGWIAFSMLLFGMVFFLLSIFWGDQLRLGEEFGELLSITILLVSTVLLAPHNQWVLGTCAVLYFVYSIVCIGILNVTSITNYVFMAVFSFIIFLWFLELGRYHSKQSASNQSPAIQS